MTFDPTQFSFKVMTDTCSVWNILSSRKLYQAACTAKVTFCITPMVLYECLYKPRAKTTVEMLELIKRFNMARNQAAFPLEACSLNDLLEVSRNTPIGLGSGELSCIAATLRLTTVSFMTDDKKARHHAENRLLLRVETTPKLYGWLHFHRILNDGDHADILIEHEKYENKPLSTFFNKAYEIALQYRLIKQQKLLQAD